MALSNNEEYFESLSSETASSSTALSADANSYQVIRLNHHNKMTNALETMLYEEMLCDVTIICNGQSVKAHRVILAASSAYFKEIFHATPIGFNPIVFLKNFTNEDLNDILEFVYKGELVVPYHRLESLIDSAKSLGIAGLATLRLNHSDHDSNINQDTHDTLQANSIDGDDLCSDTTSATAIQMKYSKRPAASNTNNRKRRNRKIVSTTVTSSTVKPQKFDLNIGITNNNDNGLITNRTLINYDSNSIPMTKPLDHISKSVLSVKTEPESDTTVSEKILRNRNSLSANNNMSNLKDSIMSKSMKQQINSSIKSNESHLSSDIKADCSEVDESLAPSYKITKFKLRSWSQQIMEKNLTALKLSQSVPLGVNGNKDVTVVNNGSNSSPILQKNMTINEPLSDTSYHMIKLQGRPRGRPRKIANIPQLAPILRNSSNNKKKFLSNGNVNKHVNGNGPPVKRSRGRPPLYQRDSSINSAVLTNPKLYFSSKPSSISIKASNNSPIQTKLNDHSRMIMNGVSEALFPDSSEATL